MSAGAEGCCSAGSFDGDPGFGGRAGGRGCGDGANGGDLTLTAQNAGKVGNCGSAGAGACGAIGAGDHGDCSLLSAPVGA
ncbi:MAG: hypothetical protein WDW38_006049 [Sanguina aurantia]